MIKSIDTFLASLGRIYENKQIGNLKNRFIRGQVKHWTDIL
jgi:hypothetical protein